ncbi:Uncharacterized protein PBTT_01646 [Plasmodiophora brassicae]|uniref:Uncharacterized protein n=1 Tax=Plasmodiophora brassicae TaxID=37360 RepID=A0A3P3Y2G5_PLABS|nr:unnamed protein product [Plasmodiophora brassicae]
MSCDIPGHNVSFESGEGSWLHRTSLRPSGMLQAGRRASIAGTARSHGRPPAPTSTLPSPFQRLRYGVEMMTKKIGGARQNILDKTEDLTRQKAYNESLRAQALEIVQSIELRSNELSRLEQALSAIDLKGKNVTDILSATANDSDANDRRLQSERRALMAAGNLHQQSVERLDQASSELEADNASLQKETLNHDSTRDWCDTANVIEADSQRLKQDLAEQVEHAMSVRSSIESCTATIEDEAGLWRDRAARVESACSDITPSRLLLSGTKKSLIEQFELVQADVKTARQEIRSLEAAHGCITDLLSQKAVNADNIRAVEKELQMAELTLQEYSKTINEAGLDKGEIADAICKHQHAKEALISRIEPMENDLAHLKHKLDAVSLDLIRYQGELAARQDALDSGRDARLAAESDVDQRITDTSRMLSCLSRQLQVLESVSDANKKLYEEQQGAVDLLASGLSQLDATLQHFSQGPEETEALSRVHVHLSGVVSDQAGAISACRGQLADLQHRLDLEMEINKKKTELATISRQWDEVSKEVALIAETSQDNSEIEHEEAQLDQLETAYLNANDELQRCEHALACARQEHSLHVASVSDSLRNELTEARHKRIMEEFETEFRRTGASQESRLGEKALELLNLKGLERTLNEAPHNAADGTVKANAGIAQVPNQPVRLEAEAQNSSVTVQKPPPTTRSSRSRKAKPPMSSHDAGECVEEVRTSHRRRAGAGNRHAVAPTVPSRTTPLNNNLTETLHNRVSGRRVTSVPLDAPNKGIADARGPRRSRGATRKLNYEEDFTTRKATGNPSNAEVPSSREKTNANTSTCVSGPVCLDNPQCETSQEPAAPAPVSSHRQDAQPLDGSNRRRRRRGKALVTLSTSGNNDSDPFGLSFGA